MENENERAKLAILTVLLCSLILGFMLLFSSCRTKYIPVVEEHTKDSAVYVYQVDTFYQVVNDSIVVQMPCSDSIEVAFVDRWHTNTIYKTKELHDTIRVAQMDKEPQIVEVEKEVTKNSGFARFCIGFFFAFLLGCFATIAWRLLKM